MNHLIIGASGLIGAALQHVSLERSNTAIGTRLLDKGSRAKTLDVSDRQAVLRVVRNLEPDVIFFCAGSSDPKYSEKNPEKSYQLNVIGLKNVLDAALRVNSKLVFLSTALIFDGTKGPYNELDTPNPQTVYGWHKLLGEHLIATSDLAHLIIRTDSVFGWDRLNKNPVCQITNLLKHERAIKLADDTQETPIYSRCLANATMDLVEKNKQSVFHISGNETVSPFKFGINVAEVFGLDNKLIKPAKANTLKSKGLNPTNTCLSNKKARKVISTTLTNTTAGLKQMLKDEL